MTATILRGEPARRATVRPFQLTSLTDEAYSLLSESKREAETVVRRARQQADEMIVSSKDRGYEDGLRRGKQQGFKEGYAAGHAQGLREAREEASREFTARHTELCQALEQVLTTIEGSRRELFAAATRDVLSLAIAIAERITKRIGALDPGVAVENVKAAVELVGQGSDLVVHLCPRDMATIKEAAPALASTMGGLQRFAFVEDSEITPGGCLVRTTEGEIDARLETQLQQIVGELVPDANA